MNILVVTKVNFTKVVDTIRDFLLGNQDQVVSRDVLELVGLVKMMHVVGVVDLVELV